MSCTSTQTLWHKTLARTSLTCPASPDAGVVVGVPVRHVPQSISNTFDAFGSQHFHETGDTLPLYLFEDPEVRLGFAHGLFIPSDLKASWLVRWQHSSSIGKVLAAG